MLCQQQAGAWSEAADRAVCVADQSVIGILPCKIGARTLVNPQTGKPVSDAKLLDISVYASLNAGEQACEIPEAP
jgi:hypothetical protein